MGLFLRNARGKNWELYGIEPSPTLSEIAREKWGIHVFTGFLKDNDSPDAFFDVITMTDVFEHMRRPLEELGYVRRLIKDDGLLFIKVPNGAFNLLKLYSYRGFLHRFHFPHDVFRDIFDSREHVVHYTQKTMIKMLHKAGFQPIVFQVAPPVQIPAWRSLVGEYFQYPTPWFIDWKVKSVRYLLYLAAKWYSSLGGAGARISLLAPNFSVLATPFK
jgi:SAM-dependent methyltransferase